MTYADPKRSRATPKPDEVLREALRRYDDALEFDRVNRKEALDDLEFVTGRQWPDNVKSAREAASRPILTINRMPRFLRQVTSGIRRVNPAIRVSAADGEATSVYEETAESAPGLPCRARQTC